MRNFCVVSLVFFCIVFSLSAQNRGGDREVGEIEIIDARGEVVGHFTEAHALVIGQSEYTNGWRRLPGVKDDFTVIKALLEGQSFNVETLQDANGIGLKNGIIRFLDTYGYRPDARIIVYFAGHGATLDLDGRKMGYIVPVDAPLSKNDKNQINEDFLQKAIPMAQFEAWAVQYRSRHILFVFDSCFAGSVFRSQGAEPPAISRLIGSPVRQFITSGDADEEVPDESIFRREFEHAIKNGAADLNNDGYVSGTELGLYLYDKVSNYTRSSQNPRVGKLNNTNLDKGDFIFYTGTPEAIADTTTQPPITRPEGTAAQPSVKTPNVITEDYSVPVGRSATITFTGDTPSPRDKQTIISGLRRAVQTWNIDLDFTENANDMAAFGFNITRYINSLPSGLLQAEVTTSFSRNGKIMWETDPYYITETNESMIARRISERLRNDQSFFGRVNEAIR